MAHFTTWPTRDTGFQPVPVAHAFRIFIAFAVAILSLTATLQAATGKEDPNLASFDRLMTTFVAEHKVPGASLAVARNGKLVYARGFGFADVDKKEPVEPNSLFRIASLTKPFTAVAIMQLVEKGRLGLEDKWLDVLRLTPRPDQKLDPRLKTITIRELLQHRGGWDRDKSFDPMFRPLIIARAMDSAPPAGPAQIIQYMLGQPLDFDPGQRYAYSNFGYCILGRVIEKVSGEPYEEYVQQHVLAPLGIGDMRTGRSLLEFRAQNEVHYYARGNTSSVFPANLGQRVPSAYGGWNLEAMDSHGAWIASAADLVKFAVAFDEPSHSKILSAKSINEIFSRPPGEAGFAPDGQSKPVYYGFGWDVRHVGNSGKLNTWHNGQLDGTSTLLVRRHDGLAWAVLFNASHDPDRKVLATLIDPLVHKAADEVRKWPDRDLFNDVLK